MRNIRKYNKIKEKYGNLRKIGKTTQMIKNERKMRKCWEYESIRKYKNVHENIRDIEKHTKI